MDRRGLLRLAGASVVGLGLAGVAAGCDGQDEALPTPQTRGAAAGGGARNVVVVVADDMRLDELPYTRHVRALAGAGVSFTRFRVPTPMCIPARAGFLRGQLATGPHGTGVTSQSAGLPPALRGELLPGWLSASGSTCGLVGKYLNATARPLPDDGWSSITTTLGKGASDSLGYRVWDGAELGPPVQDERQEERFAREVEAFVAEAPEPWFLWFASRSPHTPMDPLPEDLATFEDLAWPYAPSELEGRPTWMQALPEPSERDLRLMRGFQRLRLAELAELDRTVGRLWSQLEAAGLRDRTVLAFVSDNGNALYDQRIPLLGKGMPYDVCARVPMLLAGGGLPAGVEVDAPTLGPDLTATVLDLAGATARVPQDGTSLLEVLAHPERYAKRAVLGHCAAERAAVPGTPPSDWIATVDRKLIRYREPRGGFARLEDRYELFDLADDPDERINLAWDPAWRQERDALEARLDDLLATGRG